MSFVLFAKTMGEVNARDRNESLITKVKYSILPFMVSYLAIGLVFCHFFVLDQPAMEQFETNEEHDTRHINSENYKTCLVFIVLIYALIVGMIKKH